MPFPFVLLPDRPTQALENNVIRVLDPSEGAIFIPLYGGSFTPQELIEDGSSGKVAVVEKASRNRCPGRFSGVIERLWRWRGTLSLAELDSDRAVLEQRVDQRTQRAESPPRLQFRAIFKVPDSLEDRLC